MLHNSNQNINLAPLNFGPTTGEYYKQPSVNLRSNVNPRKRSQQRSVNLRSKVIPRERSIPFFKLNAFRFQVTSITSKSDKPEQFLFQVEFFGTWDFCFRL